VLVLVAVLLAVSCSRAPRTPSIVLVTLDTTRADYIGAYGAPDDPTPVLDRLAQAGVLFEAAQAQAAVTPVSHASLFTGMNPQQHGLRTLHGDRDQQLPRGVVTLAEQLRDEGYDTAAFVSSFPCSSYFGLDHGFDVFDDHSGFPTRGAIGAGGLVYTGFAQRASSTTTDLALRWLGSRSSSRPYFLWVHYFDPHDPLLLPDEDFLRRTLGLDSETMAVLRDLSRNPAGFAEAHGGNMEDVERYVRLAYEAEVRYVDVQLGRLLSGIRGRADGDRVLLAVAGDHGEGLNDHDWWGHGILYQEQLQVPLVLAGPGLPGGIRVPDRVRLLDLAPTILDVVRARPLDRAVTGVSLVPLILDRAAGHDPEPESLPGPAYADAVALMRYGAPFVPNHNAVKNDQLYSWIEGDLKLIYHRLAPENSQLYDLRSDPGERVNLRSTRPDAYDRLLTSLLATRPLTDYVEMPVPVDSEVADRLRALGYLSSEDEPRP
jgi:arylsulfatase A-like enzyme